MMAEDIAALTIGLIIGGLAVWLWHRAHRKPVDDADMQDWQVGLRHSALVGDLTQQSYVAHCKWMRRRPDWTVEPHERRRQIRNEVTEMLERLAQS